MKFYNPFKAHVVQFPNGMYVVRKLNIVGFGYLDKDTADDFWWHHPDNYIRCSFMATKQEAKARLDTYNTTCKSAKQKFICQ